MKAILISAVIISVYSSAFADSRSCKATIEALYRQNSIEVQIIEVAKSKCEINSNEMQLCLTGEKFFNNDKTSEGLKELFGICDVEVQTKINQVYFN